MSALAGHGVQVLRGLLGRPGYIQASRAMEAAIAAADAASAEWRLTLEAEVAAVISREPLTVGQIELARGRAKAMVTLRMDAGRRIAQFIERFGEEALVAFCDSHPWRGSVLGLLGWVAVWEVAGKPEGVGDRGQGTGGEG